MGGIKAGWNVGNIEEIALSENHSAVISPILSHPL